LVLNSPCKRLAHPFISSASANASKMKRLMGIGFTAPGTVSPLMNLFSRVTGNRAIQRGGSEPPVIQQNGGLCMQSPNPSHSDGGDTIDKLLPLHVHDGTEAVARDEFAI
jgi:hypothetical protein